MNDLIITADALGQISIGRDGFDRMEAAIKATPEERIVRRTVSFYLNGGEVEVCYRDKGQPHTVYINIHGETSCLDLDTPRGRWAADVIKRLDRELVPST